MNAAQTEIGHSRLQYSRFSSQNLVPSRIEWSEDKASFRGLQASEREKELFKFEFNL